MLQLLSSRHDTCRSSNQQSVAVATCVTVCCDAGGAFAREVDSWSSGGHTSWVTCSNLKGLHRKLPGGG